MKSVFICVAICILATAAPLAAQSFSDSFIAELGGGFTVPVGVTGDHTNVGWNFVANAGPRLSNNFGLVLDFTAQGLGVDAFQNVGNDTNLDADATMLSFTLNPVYDFVNNDRVSAYAIGGYGVYYRDISINRVDFDRVVECDLWWGVCGTDLIETDDQIASANTWKGGYNVGGGVAFGSNQKFFFEVRYHHMFTTNESTQTVPFTFGIRW